MKKIINVLSVIALALLSFGVVYGDCCWYKEGYVYLDSNYDGKIDANDEPLAGVVVKISNEAGTFSAQATTDANGYFKICLPSKADSYIETLDETTIPEACYVIPKEEIYYFSLTDCKKHDFNQWLLCKEGKCWLTAGGVKFEPILDADMAEKGPKDSLGGNVYPGCNPDSGDGGQWNHLAHREKLHFQGWTIQVVECGNVPGIDPGSDSPKTPYNYIEFMGTGTLKGIHGYKYGPKDVAFYARCEDRNEPGSDEANAGAYVDRYFLHVYDPVTLETLLLIDENGNAADINPVTITGGNLQIHISSCDNPPE